MNFLTAEMRRGCSASQPSSNGQKSPLRTSAPSAVTYQNSIHWYALCPAHHSPLVTRHSPLATRHSPLVTGITPVPTIQPSARRRFRCALRIGRVRRLGG
ncbi:MAG: hypothetical protein EI684_17990 [Candidatus Viridilinea halotolerans]|uniref:Uncharacterized protein n=1 Tax=Candidatus Viridilinea halotolerans TaxID=2491704 RepID=A0A426TTM7_9CHLR|nr:MAG: hypothetical protein EI684_17990 [Candidatus Viridilinea halotolerans]